MRTAVALASRSVLAPEVPRDQVLGGEDPALILAGMEALLAVLLRDAHPDDGGAGVLGRLGLAFAAMGR
jgi:hypothetical protein